jgi:O-acetyl-ADP-ribose deacetylase (regulator of RNase III)
MIQLHFCNSSPQKLDSAMIEFTNASIFTLPAQTLVNTVNTVGVMGKGIALEFKNRNPRMFNQYRDICRRTDLRPGKLWLYSESKQWVLNFPTKIDWRNPSKIEYVEAGLKTFVSTYRDLGITSIAFPPLGCGNGGLHWPTVRAMMTEYLAPLDIPVTISTLGVE